MSEQSARAARMTTTPSQETLARLWEDHIRHEFETRSTEDTLATMVEDAYVDHVPVLTGGSGKAELREFYATHFIPRTPPGRGSHQLAGVWRSRWSWSSDSGTANWHMSTFIGTKPRCWSNSVCSTQRICPSRASRAPGRSLIPQCQLIC